ncbi:MAG TPA: DUF881 domain-containing protein [Pseudonocardiaceae bacterium]|nr:DUF881 domain-containing protein [Pseudonocardiaceae bacterium]
MRRVDGWQVAVLVVCLLAGLLFGVSRSSADGYDLRGGRTLELSGLVRVAEARVAAAQARLAGLNTRLRDLEQVAARSDGRIADATARAKRLEPEVGLSPLVGPGMVVTLTDAPRGPDGRYPAGVAPDVLVVHQQDVQSVLNGLWAGGAEAVAVQDQRLVATSAVRCIGNTLLLGGRTYSPPYVITAIGEPARLQSGLDKEDGVRLYQQYAQAYGLGYDLQVPRTVSVPAYAGSLRLVSAQEVPQ